MIAVLLAVAAALGTFAGLFLGMPAAGFVLWPLTRATCRVAGIEIDPHDEDDPVMKVEGSLVAGLGMAIGVGGSVALVGVVALAPQAWVAAGGAGSIAGLTFGTLWRHGYARLSAAPFVLITALVAGLTAGLLAW